HFARGRLGELELAGNRRVAADAVERVEHFAADVAPFDEVGALGAAGLGDLGEVSEQRPDAEHVRFHARLAHAALFGGPNGIVEIGATGALFAAHWGFGFAIGEQQNHDLAIGGLLAP